MKVICILCILAITLILCAGCISTVPSPEEIEPLPTGIVPPRTPTPIPTEVPSTQPIPVPTTIQPYEEIIVPDPVQTPGLPAEPDISKQIFLEYTGLDFTMKYPSGWTVLNTTVDAQSHRLYERDEFREPANVTTFLSGDTKTKLVATAYIYLVPGYREISSDIQAIRNKVTLEYPGVDGYYAVLNHKYYKDPQMRMVLSYDIVIPQHSDKYPYTESVRVFSTYYHQFRFEFVDERGELDTYRELARYLFDSVQCERSEVPVRY